MGHGILTGADDASAVTAPAKAATQASCTTGLLERTALLYTSRELPHDAVEIGVNVSARESDRVPGNRFPGRRRS
jgi:hypothetical protein